jgi:hypothetical protein
MSIKKMSIFMAVFSAVMLAGATAFAAHSGGGVTLKDAAGADINPGSSTPYSPKQTCGVCHNYESDPVTVTKDHGPGTPAYDVVAPQHGVSAGYHFQQGRNIGWNSDNNNAQRSFYGLAKFTSSPGMYGKY